MTYPLVECVPNISEGMDEEIIAAVVAAASNIDGCRVLSAEPDADYNRTVITLAGDPKAVSESAFQLIKESIKLIDMRKHSGNHARLGAVDVCPFVPLQGIDMQSCAELAKQLAVRVSEELNLPAYLYGAAASSEQRGNHSLLRKGEYEGLEARMSEGMETAHENETRLPDFGPTIWSEEIAKTGAVIIGARDILVAYNVNLQETDARVSAVIGKTIRQSGPVIKNSNGNRLPVSGMLAKVQGMGFPLDEHGISQVSMNLQDISVTPMHVVYETIKWLASNYDVEVSGSELVGLVPIRAMLDAGRWYAPDTEEESELISAAVEGMGLNDLAPFIAKERIIEMAVRGGIMQSDDDWAEMSLREFQTALASSSPTPGGGTAAAVSLGQAAALTCMVADLTIGNEKWKDGWKDAETSQDVAISMFSRSLDLATDDSRSFDGVMMAYRLPKDSDDEKDLRKQAIREATLGAAEVPLETARLACSLLETLPSLATTGNGNAVTDVGVASLLASAACKGALFNVEINLIGMEGDMAKQYSEEASQILEKSRQLSRDCMDAVRERLNS